MRFFNSSPLKKWPLFRRRIFSVAFSWMKSFVFLLKCHWRLFLRVQLTITQPWFRKWLGAEYATSHYLKHCWPDCLMHICGTRGRWEFKVTLLSISSCGLWWPDDVMQNGRRNLAIFVTLQRWNLFQYRLWLINMFDYVGTKYFIDWNSCFICFYRIQKCPKQYQIWNHGRFTCLIFKLNSLIHLIKFR